MGALRPIGNGELEILQYVQDHQTVTVRQVAEHLAATKGLVRTTALNVMNRLVAKGYLSRKKVDGVFQYAPRIAKGRLLRGLVKDFVEGTLGGSVSPFVTYLADEAEIDAAGLAELKKLVSELDRRAERKEG